MPTTYTILRNLDAIGTCEGIPITENGRPFILIPPSYLDVISVGDILVTPDGKYLTLYLNDYVHENGELKAIRFYYE